MPKSFWNNTIGCLIFQKVKLWKPCFGSCSTTCRNGCKIAGFSTIFGGLQKNNVYIYLTEGGCLHFRKLHFPRNFPFHLSTRIKRAALEKDVQKLGDSKGKIGNGTMFLDARPDLLGHDGLSLVILALPNYLGVPSHNNNFDVWLGF